MPVFLTYIDVSVKRSGVFPLAICLRKSYNFQKSIITIHSLQIMERNRVYFKEKSHELSERAG